MKGPCVQANARLNRAKPFFSITLTREKSETGTCVNDARDKPCCVAQPQWVFYLGEADMFTRNRLNLLSGLLAGLVMLPGSSSAAVFCNANFEGPARFERCYTDWKTLPSGGTHIWKYNCNSNETVIYGGFDSHFSGTFGSGIRMVESYPEDKDSWRWRFKNEGPQSSRYRLVYICADH